MTNRDILVHALHHATGRPKRKLRRMLAKFAHSYPSPRLAAEVPEAEARELIARLEGEADGIRRWCLDGLVRHQADPSVVAGIEAAWATRN